MPMLMMIQRELRRVPLDFDWFGKGVWKGYKRSCGDKECINENCQDCKKIEPPTGEGYQVWETVSEGSPVTPVFATKEEVCKWLSTTKREHDITNKFTYEEWMKVLADPCPMLDIHSDKIELSE